MKRILRVAFLILLIAAGVAAVGYGFRAYKRSKALTERPEKVSLPTAETTAQISSLGATLIVSYAALADILNSQAPESQSFQGRQHFTLNVTKKVEQQVKKAVGGGDLGKFAGKVAGFATVMVDKTVPHSGDIDYHGTISRSAPFQVAAHEHGLRISAPLEIHGQAGINGDLAKLLALNKKNIDGRMNAWSDCTFGMSPDWTPQITAKPDFQWESATIEIADNVRISIRGVTEEPLKEQMRKLPDALTKKLDRDAVRGAIAPFWKPYAVRLPLPGGDAFLHVAPQEVALSDIGYTAEGVRFSLALRANSLGSLSSVSPFKLTPLPDLSKPDGKDNRLRADMPLLVDYEALASAASDVFAQKTFSISTPAGPTQIKVGRVEIYPTSGGRIVLGCQTEIEFKDRPSLSTKGQVYFVAEPYVDEARQRLELRDISFRRLLDNQLWQFVSVVFEKDILAALQQGAAVDLAAKLAEAQKAIESFAASSQVQEFGAVSVKDLKLSVGRLTLTNRAFEVHARGEAELIVRLEKIRFHR
jgi:hypothetical protein